MTLDLKITIARTLVYLSVFLCGLGLSGCNQQRYQPADWRAAPRANASGEVEENSSDPLEISENRFGPLTPWTDGSIPSGRPYIANGSTLPGRNWNTLPNRNWNTLPNNQGRWNTLPNRNGTTLPMRNGTTLPMRNEGTLQWNSLPNRSSTTLPMRTGDSR